MVGPNCFLFRLTKKFSPKMERNWREKMGLLNEQKCPCILAHGLCLYFTLLHLFFFFFSFPRCLFFPSFFFFFFWFNCTLHIFFFFFLLLSFVFFFFWLFVIFLVLIGHHFQQGYMSKFIQTHFFHSFTFSLLTKQKWGKLKYFLSFHFSTLSTKWTLRVIHFLYHRFLTNLTVKKIALNDYCFPPYLPK